MKLKIQRYKYEKVLDTEFEIDIPEIPEYHFETGIRRSIAIIPEWTTWNKEYHNKEEEIYKLNVVCVYRSFESKIETHTVNISYLKQRPETLKGDIIDFIVNIRDKTTSRTKEEFLNDYNSTIEDFNKTLNYE